MAFSDKWHVRYTHNGNTHVKAIGTKKDAEAFEASVKLSRHAGAAIPGQEKMITWKEAVSNFNQWFDLNQVKGSTAEMYGSCLNRLQPVFGHKYLQEFKASDLISYQAYRIKAGKKPATINREIATIKRIFSLHCDWNSASTSPMLHSVASDIVRVPLLPENNFKHDFWTMEQAQRLIDCCKSDRLKMIVTTGLMTGLRLSNILNLRWDQVGFDYITIQADEMKAGNVLTIPLHPELASRLKVWKMQSGFREWVFKEDGRSLQSWFSDNFNAARKRAGITESFHIARHTFASHFMMNGGDIATLSELLGHSDIGITKKRYAHLSQEHKRDQVIKFAMEV